MCAGPAIRSKACADVSFRPFPEFLHRLVDSGGARPFRDGVASAKDPRGPRVVPLENRRGRERGQRVKERELVAELPAAAEALMHERDRVVGVALANREDGANVERQIEEPRASVLKHRGRLIEQALRLLNVARRQRHASLPDQGIANPPRKAQHPEPFNTGRKPVAGGSEITLGLFHVPEQMSGHHRDVRVGNLERQRTGNTGASACVISLREPHHGGADQRS